MKRPAVIVGSDFIFNLMRISGLIYSDKSLRKNVRLSQTDASKILNSLLKSKSSMKWYSNLYIRKIESDKDIEFVNMKTEAIFRAKPLLAKTLDCDDITLLTKENMKDFLRVLG